MPHSVVIDGSQQEDKHVLQPQVHIVGQTIDSGRLIGPNRFQHLPDLILRYATLTPSRFGRRKARKVSERGVELSSLIKSFKKYCRNSLQMASLVVRYCPSGDVTLAICRSVACLSSSARNSWARFVASQYILFNLSLTTRAWCAL